jgi:glucose dehydrogenase
MDRFVIREHIKRYRKRALPKPMVMMFLWVTACVLASALTPVARAADWEMSGNDLTNDRNQPHEILIGVDNVATLKPAWTFKTLGRRHALYRNG